MAARRKRRTKAEIEADRLKKEAEKAEEQKMLDAGYEKVRRRNERGHFIKDDPNTPEDEAWEWRKIEEEVVEKEVEMNFGSSYEKEIDEIVEEAAKEEPVKSAESVKATSPAKAPHASYTCRFKRTRARKRGRL